MVRYITVGWILAGNQTGPKGNTDWVVAVSVGTANPFSRQAIYIGCLNIGHYRTKLGNEVDHKRSIINWVEKMS